MFASNAALIRAPSLRCASAKAAGSPKSMWVITLTRKCHTQTAHIVTAAELKELKNSRFAPTTQASR